MEENSSNKKAVMLLKIKDDKNIIYLDKLTKFEMINGKVVIEFSKDVDIVIRNLEFASSAQKRKLDLTDDETPVETVHKCA